MRSVTDIIIITLIILRRCFTRFYRVFLISEVLKLKLKVTLFVLQLALITFRVRRSSLLRGTRIRIGDPFLLRDTKIGIEVSSFCEMVTIPAS